MITASMLDPALSSRLCLMLVHSLWQVALLAAIVWCCERLLRWSVERRYLMYVAAMVFALLLLPMTFVVVDVGTLGEAAITRPVGVDEPQQVSLAPIEVAAPLPVDVEATAGVSAPAKPQAVGEAELVAQQPGIAAVEISSNAALWTMLAPWLAAAYVAGVGLMLLRLMFAVWSAQRLVLRSRPVSDPAILMCLEQLARRLSVRSRPVVAYSEQVLVPRIVGLLRPVILLPTSAMTGLAPEQVEMILAHELTHLRRYDMWVNLLQRVAEAVLFFNPPLWYLSHRINVLREYCCDDAVCRATSENADDVRCRYAAALLQVAELSRSSAAVSRLRRTPDAAELTTLAASGRSPSQLRRRIARLVGEPLREPLHLSRGGLLTLLTVAVAVILSSSLWPVIAQTNDRDDTAEQGEKTIGNADAQRATAERVEVIAIGTHNEKPQRWWDASGKIIERPPFEWTEGRDVSGDDRQWRRVVIRVRDLAEGEEVRWEISGEPDSWGATVKVDGEKNPRGYYTRQFVVPEGHRDLRLRVGIASGEWKTVAAFGTHNTIEVKDAEPSFISAGTFAEEDGTTVFLTHDAFKPNFRVVALDKEGRTHDSGYRGGLSTSTKIYQSRITFRDLSREQIDHFKFQTRPYEWTEIDNLPLEAEGDIAPGDDEEGLFSLNVVGPDNAPVANAQVKLRTSPTITAEQIRGGTFVRQESFGGFTTMLATTDAKGRFEVDLPDRPVLFRISIELAGYGPYWTEWDSRQHPEVITIPRQFTAQLDKGWSVGGVVVDGNGDPVEGVEVRPSITPKMRPGEAKDLRAGTPVVTDADGTWLYESVPGSMSDIHIEVTHPDFQPLRRRLSRDGFEVKPDAFPVARIELSRGLTVTGRVTGESGEPIVGALVRTKFLNDIRETKSNEAGEYRLTGCEPGKAQIVVSGSGQAIEMQDVLIGPDMEPVNFSMKSGRKIRIRVVDEQGKGIPKARIFFQRWRGSRAYFAFQNVNQFADENGVWVWSEAPIDEFQADICRPDGMQLSRQPLIARDEEYVFTPPKSLVVSGKVVDANTGEPIEGFRVIPGLRNVDPEIGFDWILGDSYVATEQAYRIRFSHTADSGFHVVRIEADGYKVARSRDISFDQGDVEIDFELEPTENANDGADSRTAESSRNLDDVLREWEEKTAVITSLHGTHQRYEYDEVFGIEKRAVGEFWYEAPDKGRIDFKPAPLEDNKSGKPLVSRKSGASGQPYKIETEAPMTWICDGKSIVQIEHETRTYALSEIPPHEGENIMDDLLPILFGINPLGADADRLRERYALSLGSQHNKTGSDGRKKYHIVALPLLQSDALQCQRVEVILDAQYCLPSAIRRIDPAGSKETVYVFPLESMKANESDRGRNPFELELLGYKLNPAARSK
jgi:beta-lactamase regulating signal transducer with metallopeptidase domain